MKDGADSEVGGRHQPYVSCIERIREDLKKGSEVLTSPACDAYPFRVDGVFELIETRQPIGYSFSQRLIAWVRSIQESWRRDVWI